MPSQQEVRWSQLKVGVIVLIAVVILTTLLFLGHQFIWAWGPVAQADDQHLF